MDPAPRVSFDSCWDWTVEVCLKDGSFDIIHQNLSESRDNIDDNCKDGSFDITQENLSESRNTIDDDRKGGSFDII